MGRTFADSIGKIKDILTTHYIVKVAQVDALIDTVANRTVDVLSFFEIPPGDMKPFSQILQDANADKALYAAKHAGRNNVRASMLKVA